MKNIQTLDVTLRDGGCVNDFNFGGKYISEIVGALEEAGLDFIEVGYIDDTKGSVAERTQYLNEKVLIPQVLFSKKDTIKYLAMTDYGKFDFDKLGERTPDGLDGIRLAFHKKDWRNALLAGRKILDKGYDLYVQPMLTLRYSDQELLELIAGVNMQLRDASAFYIVDSFGEMRRNDVLRTMYLVDNNLDPGIKIGFHSHNNLQLSYANAMTLLDFPSRRTLMLDASVMGMGKGAGNLNTELLLEHLNLYCGKSYNTAPLMRLIDQVIGVLHQEYYWGYSLEYYLSSLNHCTPSYAGHFYHKHRLSIDQVAALLKMIPEEKRISFDRAFAEQLYHEFNKSLSPGGDCGSGLSAELFEGKTVVLVAPGKSLRDNNDAILEILRQENTVSISLNNFTYDTDYYLLTRNELVENLPRTEGIIIPSNMRAADAKIPHIIEYEKWIEYDKNGNIYDSAGVMAIKLTASMKPGKIVLVGFDGFSLDVNKNYSDPSMRHTVDREHITLYNRFFKDFIVRIGKTVDVVFATPSEYES